MEHFQWLAQGKLTSAAQSTNTRSFIAYTNNWQEPLVVVTKVSAGIIKTRQKDYRKQSQLRGKHLLKLGRYLPNCRTWWKIRENRNISNNVKKEFVSALMPSVAIMALLHSLQSLFMEPLLAAIFIKPGIIIPLTTAAFIYNKYCRSGKCVRYYYGNETTDKKLCYNRYVQPSKGNCNAILTGKASKYSVIELEWSWFPSISPVLADLFVNSMFTKYPHTLQKYFPLIECSWHSLHFLSIYYQWKIRSANGVCYA